MFKKCFTHILGTVQKWLCARARLILRPFCLCILSVVHIAVCRLYVFIILWFVSVETRQIPQYMRKCWIKANLEWSLNLFPFKRKKVVRLLRYDTSNSKIMDSISTTQKCTCLQIKASFKCINVNRCKCK